MWSVQMDLQPAEEATSEPVDVPKEGCDPMGILCCVLYRVGKRNLPYRRFGGRICDLWETCTEAAYS